MSFCENQTINTVRSLNVSVSVIDVFECAYCKHRFLEKQELDQHQENCPSVGIFYRCEKCKQRFTRQPDFDCHRLTCQFGCQICQDRFECCYDLENHMLNHHYEAVINPDPMHVMCRYNQITYALAPLGKEYLQFIDPMSVISLVRQTDFPIYDYFVKLRTNRTNLNVYTLNLSGRDCFVYKQIETEHGNENHWMIAHNGEEIAEELFKLTKDQLSNRIILFYTHGLIDTNTYEEFMEKLYMENSVRSIQNILKTLHKYVHSAEKIQRDYNTIVYSYDTAPKCYQIVIHVLPLNG